MRGCVVLVCACLAACGEEQAKAPVAAPASASPRAGRVRPAPFPEGRLVTAGDGSADAIGISSPHVLGAAPGLPFVLGLAHAAPGPVRLRLLGAGQVEHELLPRRWTRLRGTTSATSLRLEWEGPQLFLARPFFGAGVGAPRPPDVLLVSLDTLRADFFDALHMPRTFALFERGVIFDRAYTTAPWTLPAHASLLAGTYPAVHGVRTPAQVLPGSAHTLAEVLAEAGLYAVAVTEGNYVSSRFGLAQGFHLFRAFPPDLSGRRDGGLSRIAESLAALREETRRLEPFPRFVAYHSYEVHSPYRPPGRPIGEPDQGGTRWLLEHDGQPVDFAAVRSLYAGEVAHTDTLLATVLGELLASGRWIVALTSDHGEEFGEHGGLLHGDTLYEEVLRVPLALVGPGVEPGRASPAPVSLIDLPVTLAALVGVSPSPSWQGRHLLASSATERPLFFESFHLGPQVPAEAPALLGVLDATHKLLRLQNLGRTRIEQYALSSDPAEKSDGWTTPAARRADLLQQLGAYARMRGPPPERRGPLSEEEVETMRALGYLK